MLQKSVHDITKISNTAQGSDFEEPKLLQINPNFDVKEANEIDSNMPKCSLIQ